MAAKSWSYHLELNVLLSSMLEMNFKLSTLRIWESFFLVMTVSQLDDILTLELRTIHCHFISETLCIVKFQDLKLAKGRFNTSKPEISRS